MKRWFILAAGTATIVTLSFRYFENKSAHGAHLPTAGTPHIAQWYDDAHAAVSFTFDDGLQCHADIAAPMLHEFGYRGTFYIVAGLTRERKADAVPTLRDLQHFRFGEAAVSWDEVRQMRDEGMEIGNHSMTHTFLNHISDDAVLGDQINHAADLIAENIGERPVTFAFPYNEYTPHDKAMALKHHLAVRENWTDFGGPTFTSQTANAIVDKAIQNHAWLVPMIHGIDGGFLPLSSSVLRENLAYLKQHSNDVWVDTYADVAKYQRERNAATLHVEESEPGETTFYITESVPVEQTVPLTVVIPLPLNQDTDDVDAHLADSDVAVPISREADCIRVDLPPNSAPVIVTWH